MNVFKSQIRLTVILLSFVFTNTVLAADSTTNESKDNGAANNASVDIAPAAASDTEAIDSQPQVIDDTLNYRKQFEERRRQAQAAQLESYKKFLERREQYFANNPAPAYCNPESDNNIPAYIQERRNDFLKQMDERRALNVKMMEQQRKAAEERRKSMQIKMHQTNTAPEVTSKA